MKLYWTPWSGKRTSGLWKRAILGIYFTLYILAAVSASITWRVLEESNPGTFVANLGQYTANFADFAISSKNFVYNKSSGNVNTKRAIDRDVLSSQCLNGTELETVQFISTNNGDKVIAKVLIYDINDNWPHFTSDLYTKAIPEDNDPGFTVKIPTAQDKDCGENGTVQYTILNSDYFQISSNQESLEIILAKRLDRELEETHTLNITACDQGIPSKCSSTILNITVTDFNDNKPIFHNLKSKVPIEENCKAGRFILALNVSDKDSGKNGQFTLSVSGTPENSKLFDITSNHDLVSTTCLVYDKSKPYIDIVINAEDQGVPVQRNDVYIQIVVVDINDHTPVLLVHNLGNRVIENNAVGPYVGILEASDDDAGENANVSLKIIDGNPNNQFYLEKIEQTSFFFLKLRGTLDREKIAVYNITIQGSDHGIPPLTSYINIVIPVQDENDNHPNCSFLKDPIFLSEDLPIGSYVTIVQGEDGDEGKNSELKFSFAHDRTSSLFNIVSSSGLITVAALLDYEMHTSITLQVNVEDNGDKKLSSFCLLSINITDTNDNKPLFTNTTFIFSLYENAAINSVVANLTAFDADAERNSELTFSMLSPSPTVEETFNIDRDTGAIHTLVSLDRESRDFYHFMVLVQDHGDPILSSTAAVKLRILDFNDNHPVFYPEEYYVNLQRNQTNGFIVNVTAKDVDKNDTVFYEIIKQDPLNTIYNVSKKTGSVTFAEIPQLDANDVFTLDLIARDSQGHVSNISSIYITVITSQDDLPQFENELYNFDVEENVQAKTYIGKVKATCKTCNDILYSIHSGDQEGVFFIDKHGEIRTLGDVDHEKQSLFKLRVMARTMKRRVLIGWATVVIVVDDVNDNPPMFQNPLKFITVWNTAPVGSFVYKVTASDPDLGNGGILSYEISQDSHQLFSIRNSGDIIITKDLSQGQNSSLMLTIIVSDFGFPQLSSVLNLTIDIIKGNSQPPYIHKNHGVIPLLRNTRVNQRFFNVTASDPDGDGHGKVYFRMFYGDKVPVADLFGIFPEGNLFVKKSLFLTNQSNFSLRVIATDAEPKLNSTSLIHISVLQMQHHQKLFQKDTFRFCVYENENTGTVVGKLDFVAKFQNLNVGLVDENSYFAFDHVTSEIKTKKDIDREKFKLTTGSNDYILYAKASYRNDFGLHAIDLSTIVVEVKDRNDNVPVFSQSNYVINIEEIKKVGTVIFKFRTHDNDEGNNAKVNYSIVHSSLPGAVIVNDHGMVILNKQLEKRAISYFNFSVQVMNTAPPYFNSSCFVEANILDVNNNEPQFAKFLVTKHISENSVIGREIYRAKASDSDKGRNSRLTYTITSGNQERNFEIDRESGEVKLVRELDFERTQSFVLTILAVDSGVVPLSTTQILIVNVTDVNDNYPQFMDCPSSLKLTEDIRVGSAIMQCRAVDRDVGNNGLVRYSISRQKPTGQFFRISSNGTVYVSKPLDRERFPIYKIDIKAEDSALSVTSRLMSTKTVTIELEDVNDNSPRFISPPAVNIDVSLSKGDYVTTLKAWDPDLGSNGTFTFSKGSGRDAKYFNVEESGRVTFASALSWNILYILNVIVTDFGAERKKSEQELAVFIYKKGGLSFLQSVYTANVVENEAVGTFLINVTAVPTPRTMDTKVRYFMTNDSSEGLLSLDAATGVITVKERIDREGKRGHQINLIIFAVDVNSNTSTSVRVRLRILDLNDNIPTFRDYVYTNSVSEGTEIGSDLVLLDAHDDDDGRNGSIKYEIVSGDQKTVFHINESTGQISVAKNLDHEAQSSYTLNVTASDNGIPSLSSWTVVLISIIDVNDNGPAFQRRNYSFTVVENYPFGTIIGQTIACDPDSGENGHVSYSLTGEDAHLFSVNEKNGKLRTAFSFDRETIDFYLLKVVATDNGSPTALSSVTLVYISILDENDNSPQFNSSHPYIATVKENVEVGTYVITVNASDKDVGVNSTLHYAITGGDIRNSFRISNRGTLFTTSSIDREDVAQYNLKITVRDSAAISSQRRSSTTMVIVHVGDVNDCTPYFVSKDVIRVKENQVLGRPFAVVLARDEDTDLNGKVSYELQGYLAKSLFQIDQDSGKLSLRQALDREKLKTGKINITVEAKDHGKPPKHNQQYIHIIVEDVNDNSPMFESHLKFLSVYENISIGSELLRVNAVDKDQGLNGKIEFVISAGNVNDTFSIHSIDGVIILIRPLDREIIQNYQIQITAFDLGSPQRKNVTAVHIYVLDVNDNKPRFKRSPSSKSIGENIPFFGNWVHFVAVDDDKGRNGEVVYSIFHPERTPFLRIDNTTGVISLMASLDREAQSSYSIMIKVSDNGSPAQHIQTKFSILVKDKNDNSPVFVNPDLKPSIREASPVGSELCVMNATDADYGVNADISYELVKNFGRFKIDPKTGRIFTIAELDREIHGAEFELAVKAVDKGNPTRAAVVTVIGRIDDINDNQAEFEPKAYLAYIPFRAPNGTFVTVVTAFDKDEGINGQVIYRLENNSKEFSVEPDTGHVFTARRILSFITHTLRIQAISADNNLIQDVATVNITATRNHFPSFNIPVAAYNISEDAKPGYYILNVKVTDNPTLNIESGDPDKQFSLDIVSKNLTLNKNLDYERKNHYNLWLKASLNAVYSTYTNIQVFVVDSNDNIPVFQQSHYDAFVTETDKTNVSVICVLAEDSDSGAFGLVEYKIPEESALEWFHIDRNRGCIYTTRRIDRERNVSFDFTVQARDHGLPPNTNNVSVRVNILDANDNPPILDKISPVYLLEDESPNILVTTVFAYDQDETSKILYSLKPQGNYMDTFNIIPTTGEVFLTKRLDRETVGHYPLTVSVTDGKFSNSASLTIIIKDVDDNPPTFTKSSYSVKFMELQPVGSVIMKLNISDRDIGCNTDVVYSFMRTPTSEMFRIDSRGIISSASRFRFNKPTGSNRVSNLYNLIAHAYNPNHPSAKPTATVVVEITDANDHYPVFENDEKYAYIPSVSKNGTRIITVRAVDRYDVGLNSEVSYKVTGGNGTSLFLVESTTGHVTVAGSISSEIDKLFLLEVQAVDRGTPPQVSPTNMTVFITVTIKNQHAPRFTEKYSRKLKENYETGKEFLRVNAKDDDIGINGKVKYSILPGKQGKYFNVDSHTGSLTIGNVKLDYEFLKVYMFDVQAKDCAKNPRTDQATVTVTVLDYNDNPPEFQNSLYEVNIAENNEVGSEVVRISATDRDTIGKTITYTFDSENKNFKIDQNSGKITTKVKFDYESQSNFTLTVLAKDSGDPQKTSETTVVVNILGINEFTPDFKKKTYVFSVPEDADVGQVVGQVSASDQDKGVDGLVQFILVDPSGRHNSFDIDEYTGNIYVCGRLDFETVQIVELTVLAKNPVQRILNADNTDKANVKIKIQDRNDPPRFLKDFMKVSVNENIPVGSVLGNFTAIDEDTKKDFLSTFKYTILNGNINDSFMLEKFGESVGIKTSKPLDREAKDFFNLTIAASDISNQNLSSHAYLLVEVKDINDNSPFLKRGTCPGRVKEGLKIGTVVLRFDATDKDVDPNKDPYTFEILNKEYVPFVIEKSTLELKTSEILDREKVNLYVLRIKIEDSGYPRRFSTTSCNVIVDDVNDNRPFGDTLNVQVSVPATGFLGGIIGDVTPHDLDEIKEFTCEVEGNYKDIFDFRPKTCILNMKKPQLKHYILNVIARDDRHRVSYTLNISFNTISEITSERSVILRLSGISTKQFLTVMNNLPCIPNAQIYSIQKVNSTITDVLLAYLQNGAYISRDKLSQILANCTNILERAIGANIVDTNYNLCSTSDPCIHGSCESRIYLSSGNRTSLSSGTEVFVSAYHKATFYCHCDKGYCGEYCRYSTETALDLCDPNPCGKASQCVSTCKGPICQCDFGGRGKRCELSSIGFKPLSYMTFPSLSSTDENTKTNISLEFATVERNALILYNRIGRTDKTSRFIALEIIDGFLKYSFNLGDGLVIVASDMIVSDGIWHTASAVRNNQSAHLFIDLKIFSSNGKNTDKRELELGDSSLYISGVPSLDVLSTNDVLSHDFVGCMRDIYLNNIELNLNMTESNYGIINSCPRVPKCQQSSCHGTSTCIDKWFDTLCQCTDDEFSGTKCNEKMKPLTLSDGTVLRFEFSPSYQRRTEFLQKRDKSRRRRDVENFENFSVNVRVRNDDAFLWRAQNNLGDFTQLHTKSGLVHLSFGNSVNKRKRVIVSNVYVNNGYWFNVSLTRYLLSDVFVLNVNGSQNHTQSNEPNILLSGTWTFGSVKASEDSVGNFQGCLSKIKINGEAISLNVSNQYGLLTLEEGNLTDGCESPDYCSSSPCPDSTCVNNWHSFSCVAFLDGSDGLSIGAIAGIVFFCILVIAIIVAVVAIKKKRTRKEFAARLSGRTNAAIERDNSGSSSSMSLPSRKTPSRHSLSDSGVDVRNRSSPLSHENLKQTGSTGTNVIPLGPPEEYTIVASQHDSVSDDRDNGFTDSESEYCMMNHETNLTISSLPSRVKNRQFNRRRPPSNNSSMKYDKKVPFLANRGFLGDVYEPSRSTSPTDEPESIEMHTFSNDVEDAEQYSIGASFATYSDFNDPSYNPSRYSDDPMRYKPSLERFSESDDSTIDRQLNDLPDSFQPTAHFDNSGESSDGGFTASENEYDQQEYYEEAGGNRMISGPQRNLGRSRAESYDNVSRDQYDDEMNVDDPVDFNDIFGRRADTSREIHIKL